jgi:hypothetical protein
VSVNVREEYRGASCFRQRDNLLASSGMAPDIIKPIHFVLNYFLTRKNLARRILVRRPCFDEFGSILPTQRVQNTY